MLFKELIKQSLHYLRLMRFDQPIGFLLLLWPTLWALWISGKGHPHISRIIIFTTGAAIMRAAGCIINDIADRKFDGYVKRTDRRPLVTGKISPKSAVILFLILCSIAFGLVLILNPLSVLLSCIALLLTVVYPFTKRFIQAPQLILGCTFSYGIPIAFAAETNHIPCIAWLLFLSGVFWAIAYDTEYAMVDRLDDLKIGIKSTAILFGKLDYLIIGVLQASTIGLLMLIGYLLHLKSAFFMSIGIAGFLMCHQQRLIWSRSENLCFRAFLNNHWVGLVIFLGIALGGRR